MVATTNSYCLADIAAEHCWTGSAFVPIEYYHECRDDVLHFASRAQALAAVCRQRRRGCHLQVMAVRPGGAPRPGG
jgi:hypothetical protein